MAYLLDSQKMSGREGAAGLLRSGAGGTCTLELALAAICIESFGPSESRSRTPG